MTKKLSETLSPEELAKRKEDNHFFRTFGSFLHLIYEHFDLTVEGPMGYHFLDGLYILVHNQVLKECAFPERRSEDMPTPIPDDFRIRLVAFLEDCATRKAAFYRRDWLGYVWEIIDENIYAECCQKHGFSPTDYQVRWLKSRYDESGRPIENNG